MPNPNNNLAYAENIIATLREPFVVLDYQPNVVLLDIGLPGMNVYDVATTGEATPLSAASGDSHAQRSHS